MRLLSVRPGATVLLLVVTLLIARASLSNLHTTAAAQGTVPTATATPDPTVVPTAPSDVHDAQDQLGGLFSQIEGDPPPSSDVETLASRLVGIDFGQLANAIESPVGPKDLVTGIPQTPHKLVLNLFADVVLTGIVEHVEPTSSGHALWGGIEGVKLGTMTLVVNGSVVVGTVRTPDAVYTIRTAAAGAYVVRQIDESSLPPLGEPLRSSIPEPDFPPPVRPQIRGPDAPDGTSTPTSTPTPVPTVATSPSKPAPDEAMASGLFSEVEGDPPPSPGVDTLASRLVEIDFGQLSQVTKSPVGPKDPVTGKPTEPQALVLNLFDDVVLTGIVEHVEPTSSGHSLWGRLDGVGLGTFTLVVNGRMVIGTVRTPDAVYTIRTAGDGTYVIRQIDESSLPPLGEPLEGPVTPRDSHTQADDVPSDDGSEIDVMVVYTPLAKHREGGRAAIEALIDLFVAETNQAYVNSGVTHRIRLVLREEVDYTEDGISGIDLGRLQNGSDGYMDHIHELRNLYAADLVHIVLGRSVDACGRAAGIGGDESTGFAFTVSYCGGLVFAHELGHNMGLLHDRYQLGVPRTGSHYGYVNQRMFEPGAPESARWRTIMAYGIQCWDVAEYDCERIGSFSNPENSYNGDPMGVPADHLSTGVDGPADAVGTLNDRREITANFRRSSSSPTPRVRLTLSPYWLAEDGGVSTVTATLHRPSSADTTVTILASPSDAVTLSGSRTLTIPAGRTVSVASVTITGVDNGDQTDDVSVTVSATAANTSSLGVVDPEPVALVIADDETTPVVTLSLSPAEIVEFEGRTLITAMLDSRSSADTIVSVSAEPAELIEQREGNTLTIPAGQTENIGFGLRLQAVDNDELAEATQTVTVSGTSENPQGVAGPENVTLTIIDDETPLFADDSIAYTFTTGIAGSRFLPEAEFGNGKLTYSLSPAPSNDVIFTPGPPARIGVSATSVAADATSYTLTATDADGDTDTMTISITVRKGVCPNSAAVSGYSDPGIVHDCEALLASRDTLSVDQSLNWDEDLPIDEWKGVELADGRVVGLRMSSEGIVGTIPSELGNLSNLQGLSLWGNQLTGGIPKELGSLANLTYLALSGNQLTGGIPEELGSLSNLQSLDLHGNQLTGVIPKELGSLANLQSLDLSDNRLTGSIATELGNLSNLQELYLGGNLLTGCVPDGLRDVPNNDIVSLGLPFCSEQACVSGGAVVDATNTGLVSDCGMLLAARDTLAGTAALNWSADTPIADWTGVALGETSGRVTEILLGGIGLDGKIPKQLGSLANLQSLDLSDNKLTGTIPTELGSLANLQELYLGGNLLTGCVPDGLRDVPNNDIARLGLPFCSEHPCVSGGAVVDATNDGLRSDCERLLEARDTLAGTASLNWSADTPITEWNGVVLGGTHGRVTVLYLGAMGLNGGIPNELGSLANLQGLYLSDNQLTGEIPPELGRLSNLTGLSLDGNQLTGEIPPELGGLSNLQGLRLWGNQLTGEIPPELGGLSNLRHLGLWSNQLTGEIPPELGGLSNLTYLALSGNQLTGEIPPELGGLSNLEWLYLNDNQLTGEIPTELGNLSNLQWLYLGGNLLTGCVPAGLRDVPNNDIVSLGLPFCSEQACVSGGAVVDATNTGLVSDCGILLAARDTLAGTAALSWSADTPIADWTGVALGEASGRVTRILLLGMGLNGRIPTELGSLANLTHLILADNQLTGVIPKELENLSNLRWLYLGGNLLTGCVPAGLRDVPNNDIASLGLPFCSEHPCVSGGAVPDATNTGLISDCEALLAARDTLAGTAALNWSADTPIADWTGVALGEASGRVTILNLGALGLTGRIPPELGGLSNLTRLSLSVNQLTGEIPPELGSLSNLTLLRLAGNQLTGEIPPELGGLSNLTELVLEFNQLTGEIPPELGGLSNLQRLYLSDNRLTGCVPPRLRDVPDNDLDQLGLPFCPLSPPEASTISSVTSEMDSITISWATPLSDGGSDITAYDLRHIETDDDETVDPNWTVVEDVWTSGGDALEYTLTGLTVGTEYDIQVRAVNAVGDGTWSATVTATLTTASVCLSGGAVADPANTGLVSDCEALLSARDTLAETGSNWSEDTPIARWDGVRLAGTPQRVTRLVLPGKGLRGTIPPDLGRLSMLTDLNLRSNALTGEIPEELGNLTNLRVLNLHSNKLSGDLPDLSRITGLEELYLPNNYDETVQDSGLTGTVPTWLNGMTKMRELWLWGNQLSGTIPDLSGMTSLQKLKLANNMLTGGVPDGSMLPPNVTWLIIDSNPLGGGIPDLSELTSLRLLWLHSNGLTGSIPAGDMLPPNVDDLNLRDNMLSGEIPDLSGLDKATRVRLHGNDLTGEIPATLGDLDSLQSLWLHGNILTGSIPKELGSLTNLQRLWLSDNNLSGLIPVELGDLSSHSLVQWRLSGEEHHFTGCLPAGLAEVKDTDFNSLGLQVCTSTTGQPHVILRVVQVTEDWVPFSVAGGWTQAVLQKESDVLRYYEAAIWEETDSVHLYAFPNDYDGGFGWDEDVPDADVIAYREQYAISVHSDMPEMWGDRRSDFLRIAFEDFVSRLVELHPEADHHLMYSGHGGPGGNLFAGQLKHDDAGAFLATWTRLLGKPLGVIDMGGPCNKGAYEDLANFCRHASYYVASDLPNGGYTLDDWTYEKHQETDPETQYHRLLASNDTLEEALIERVELRRKRYEYSMNNQIRDQVEQANYVYSCARFNDFYEAFELFVDVTTIQAPSHDLYQLMLDYRAPPALLDRFRDVFVHGVDNRDFFEWKVTANGMLSPSSG